MGIKSKLETAESTKPAEKRAFVSGYTLVSRNHAEDLEEIIGVLGDSDRFAFDFETTSADPLSKDEEQKVVGISFSWAEGEAAYLPIGHDGYAANWDVSVLQRFKHLFESPNHLKVAHNAKFETHWLRKHGIKLTMPVFDPMLAVNLLKTRYTENYLGLKPLVKHIFDYDMLTFEDVTGYAYDWGGEYYKSGEKRGQKKLTKRQRKFNEVSVDDACLEYACADSDWALRLVDRLTPELAAEGMDELLMTLDIPLMLALVDLELSGWHVDRERMQELGELAEKRMTELARDIEVEIRRQLRVHDDSPLIIPTGRVHKEFNLNSTAHLRWILFDQLRMPVINRTDSGEPSADAETLEKLGKRFKIPLFDLILEYKKYHKLLSTYVKGYGKHLHDSDRLHSTIDQVFVRTGRFSSSKPNLQNCPRGDNDPLGIRNMFLAPSANKALSGKDSLFLMCDYSQIELRIFAWYSRDPNMLDAFIKGQDIHSRTAWQMFRLYEPFELDGVVHDPIEVHEVKSKAPFFRQAAKSINFGIIYGMQAQGLANDIWGNDDDEHVRKAQGLLNLYYQQYPGVTSYQKTVIGAARKKGYSETMFGRQRVIEDINAYQSFRRSMGERQAMNTPIQGSASEIIKLAMVRIHQQAPEWLRNVMQIHDEVVFEVPAERIADAAELVTEIMEQPIEGFDVPIVAEASTALRWGSKVDLILPDRKVFLPENADPEFIRRLKLGGVEIFTKAR